jgi:hypothetical protein
MDGAEKNGEREAATKTKFDMEGRVRGFPRASELEDVRPDILGLSLLCLFAMMYQSLPGGEGSRVFCVLASLKLNNFDS